MTPMPYNRANSRLSTHAFTLLELLAVMFIMSLITGISIIKLDNVIPKYRLRATARHMAETIKVARQSAIANSKKYIIIYDLSNKTYSISDNPEGESYGANNDNQIKFGTIPDDVTITDIILGDKHPQAAGTVTIQVFPTGIIEQHIIHLKSVINDKDQFYTIVVFPLTGFVRVSNTYEELSNAFTISE